MSKGRLGDVERTRLVVWLNQEAIAGKNWLRHRLGTEAAKIDEMILAGTFTIEQIAQEISVLSPENSSNLSALIGRVRSHIGHLEHQWNGRIAPHGLIVCRDDDGLLSFAISD